MGFFDDFLKTVPAEDQSVLAKYPQLQQAVSKLESDYATAARYTGQWLDWQQRNWDAEAGMTIREKELTDALADAQRNLTSAATAGSGATAGEIAKLRTEFEERYKALREENTRTLEGMNTFWGRVSTKMLPHQQEFGDNLDPNALLAYMQQHRINDPDLAYGQMVAGKRSEIAAQRQKELDEKHVLEIQEAEKRGRELAAKELAMGPTGSLPTDQTGGIAGVTARMEKPAAVSDEIKTKLAESKLGDGSVAQLGYEMYRQGAFQPQ